MSLVLKNSIVLSIATAVLASSSAVVAAERCPGGTDVQVVYKKEEEAKSGKSTKADIVDTAVKAGQFKTLAAASGRPAS